MSEHKPRKEDHEENTLSPVNIKLSKQTLHEIDKFWKDNNFKNRTEFIQKSCEFMMQVKQCRKCGALNDARGKFCCLCGDELPKTEDDEKIAILNYIQRVNPSAFRQIIKSIDFNGLTLKDIEYKHTVDLIENTIKKWNKK